MNGLGVAVAFGCALWCAGPVCLVSEGPGVCLVLSIRGTPGERPDSGTGDGLNKAEGPGDGLEGGTGKIGGPGGCPEGGTGKIGGPGGCPEGGSGKIGGPGGCPGGRTGKIGGPSGLWTAMLANNRAASACKRDGAVLTVNEESAGVMPATWGVLDVPFDGNAGCMDVCAVPSG